MCFDQNLLCFVSLYLPRSCLMLAAYNKTNIPCPFCSISKLFTLGNTILNSASRRWINYPGWIISDIKQNGMEYFLIISLLLTNFQNIVKFVYFSFSKKKKKRENENDLDLFLSRPNFMRNGIIISAPLTKAIFLQATQKVVYLSAHKIWI